MTNLDYSAEQLEKLGLESFNKWKYEDAKQYFLKALRAFHKEKKLSRSADQFKHLGDVFLASQQLEQAEQYYQTAYDIYKKMGSPISIIKTLTNISRSLVSRNPEAAFEYGRRALTAAKSTQQSHLEEDTLLNLGWLYSETNRFEDSIQYYEQAYSLMKANQSYQKCISVLIHISTCYRILSNIEHSTKMLDSALKLAYQLKDTSKQAYVLSQLGYHYDECQDIKHAMEYYEQALIIYEGLGEHLGELTMLESIGYLYLSTEQFEQALAYYERVLEVSHLMENPQLERDSHNNLAAIYLNLENYKLAEKSYQKVLALSQNLKDEQGVMEAHLRLGMLLGVTQEFANSNQYLSKAVGLARGNKWEQPLAKGLFYLGENALRQKQDKQAIQYYKDVLPHARKLKIDHLLISSYVNISQLYLRLGEPDQSIPYYTEAIAIAQEKKQLYSLIVLYADLADVYREMDNPENAFTLIEQVLDTLYEYETQINPDSKIQFLIRAGNLYFYFEEFREARIIFNDCLELNRQGNNIEQRVELLRLIGLCSGQLHEMDLFQQSYDEASKLIQNDPQEIILLFKDMASVCSTQGFLALALDYQSKIFEKSIESQLPFELLESLNELHHLYFLLDRTEPLFNLYKRAVEYLRENQFYQQLYSVLSQLSGIYLEMGQHDPAQKCLEEVLKLPLEIDIHFCQVYLSLGRILEDKPDYAEASKMFTQALKNATEFSSLPDQITALVYLALLEYRLENNERAEAYLEQALTQSQYVNPFHEAWIYSKLGAFFLELKSFTKAQTFLETALTLFRDINDYDSEQECLALLSEAYKQLNKI